MPTQCTYPGCDRAIVCRGARERDDANVVVEEYECSNEHTFHATIEL